MSEDAHGHGTNNGHHQGPGFGYTTVQYDDSKDDTGKSSRAEPGRKQLAFRPLAGAGQYESYKSNLN